MNCPSEVITLLENLGKTCSVAPESDVCDTFQESSDCECRGKDFLRKSSIILLYKVSTVANSSALRIINVEQERRVVPILHIFTGIVFLECFLFILFSHPTSVTEYSQARCLPKEIACNSDLLKLMTDCRNTPSEQYNVSLILLDGFCILLRRHIVKKSPKKSSALWMKFAQFKLKSTKKRVQRLARFWRLQAVYSAFLR